MTIAGELELLRSTKADIATAIAEKGVEMPADTPFSEYGDYIRQIGMADWGILYTTEYPEGKELTEADYLALGDFNPDGYDLSFDFVANKEILGIDFGKKPTSIPDYFLRSCPKINRPIYIPTNIKTIGDWFLSGSETTQQIIMSDSVTSIGTMFLSSTKLGAELILPNSLTEIPPNFLIGATINQSLTIPDSVTAIGDNFMQAATFNSQLTLSSNLESIGANFLQYCSTFNQPIVLPSTLKSIGSHFMGACSAFAQPLTLPASIEAIGTYKSSLDDWECYLLEDVNNFTGPLYVECPPSVLKASSSGMRTVLAYSFQNSDSAPLAYTQGIKLAGTYAQEWKNALPDNLYSGSGYGSNCRKLILAE